MKKIIRIVGAVAIVFAMLVADIALAWGGGTVVYSVFNGGTISGTLTVSNNAGATSITISPTVSTALGLNVRSDNLTKLASFGSVATETVGMYLSGTPSLNVVQNAAASGAVSAAQFKGPMTYVPNASAVTIANPTDTVTVPANQSCAVCKMTAAGVAAWTPAETNAVEGMVLKYVNTGANAITMTASAGVYAGPGSVVGTNDVVEMTYIGSQWVETNFQNNP